MAPLPYQTRPMIAACKIAARPPPDLPRNARRASTTGRIGAIPARGTTGTQSSQARATLSSRSRVAGGIRPVAATLAPDDPASFNRSSGVTHLPCRASANTFRSTPVIP